MSARREPKRSYVGGVILGLASMDVVEQSITFRQASCGSLTSTVV